MIAETALDIEQRMRAVIAEMNAKGSERENALKSIDTSEFLLSAIVEARDMKQLYGAQNKARARINKETGASNV